MDQGLRLVTPKAILRDFRPTDVDGLLGVVGDDRVTQWLSFDSRSREQTTRMIESARVAAAAESRTEFYVGVTLPEDDSEIVGLARLALGGVRAAKLGFAVRYDHHGRGIASAVVDRFVRFGFEELDLHRVTAAAGPENLPSHRVLERNGFQREGRLRDHVFTNGAWRDSILFSRLATDLPTGRPGDIAAQLVVPANDVRPARTS
ncbi:MAG: GNAT family N-acetyltransferase [Kineosporiaceae bacterium]